MKHIWLLILCAFLSLPSLALTVKNINDNWTWGRGVTAFSNVDEGATLYVNGKEYGTVAPDEICVLTWENVPLQEGNNEIIVKTSDYEDKATFVKTNI